MVECRGDDDNRIFLLLINTKRSFVTFAGQFRAKQQEERKEPAEVSFVVERGGGTDAEKQRRAFVIEPRTQMGREDAICLYIITIKL